MREPGDDPLGQSQASGDDGRRADPFDTSGPPAAAHPGTNPAAHQQDELPAPARPGPIGASESDEGDPSEGSPDSSIESPAPRWPDESGRAERVDRGGGTVADAIRSALARRS